jgi:hypothetical protein
MVTHNHRHILQKQSEESQRQQRAVTAASERLIFSPSHGQGCILSRLGVITTILVGATEWGPPGRPNGSRKNALISFPLR